MPAQCTCELGAQRKRLHPELVIFFQQLERGVTKGKPQLLPVVRCFIEAIFGHSLGSGVSTRAGICSVGGTVRVTIFTMPGDGHRLAGTRCTKKISTCDAVTSCKVGALGCSHSSVVNTGKEVKVW